MVYFFATLISCVFAFLYDFYIKKGNKKLAVVMAIISFLPLTFVSAVRYGIGTDYFAYIEVFNDCGNGYMKTEPLFWLLIQGVCRISRDPQFCFALIAIIIDALYYWFIFHESENPAYSVFLFVVTREFFCSTNGLRQYLAMSILLLSIPLIKSGRIQDLIVAGLITVAAYFMHNSVLVVCALYLFFLFNPKPWVALLVVGLSYVVPKVGLPILIKIVSATTDHYSDYLINIDPGFEASTFLMMLIIAAFVAFVSKNKPSEDKETSLLFNSSSFGVTTLALSASTHWAFIRLSYYSNAYTIAYLPHVINRIENKKWRLVSYCGLGFAYLVVCHWITLGGNQSVLNYTTIWSV